MILITDVTGKYDFPFCITHCIGNVSCHIRILIQYTDGNDTGICRIGYGNLFYQLFMCHIQTKLCNDRFRNGTALDHLCIVFCQQGTGLHICAGQCIVVLFCQHIHLGYGLILRGDKYFRSYDCHQTQDKPGQDNDSQVTQQYRENLPQIDLDLIVVHLILFHILSPIFLPL